MLKKMLMPLIVLAVLVGGCTPATATVPVETPQTAPIATAGAGEPRPVFEEVEFTQINLPGDDKVTFELPKSWKHYGNGLAFSPDEGVTLFGIKQAWVKPGVETDQAFMPESSQMMSMETETVTGRGAKCYTLLLFKEVPPGAVISEPEEMGYEWGCIFRSDDGKQKIDLFLRSEDKNMLVDLRSVVYHAVQTFTMKGQ